MSKTKEKCNCALCDPKPGQDPHPKYGFDRNLVPGVNCLVCDQPIGQEPYTLDTGLARFGQMLFSHERCRVKQ